MQQIDPKNSKGSAKAAPDTNTKAALELSSNVAKVLSRDFSDLALPNPQPGELASITTNRFFENVERKPENILLYQAIAPTVKQIAQLSNDDGVAGITREDIKELTKISAEAKQKIEKGVVLTDRERSVVEIGNNLSTNLKSLALAVGGIEVRENSAVRLKIISTTLDYNQAMTEKLTADKGLSPEQKSALRDYSEVVAVAKSAIELDDISLASRKLTEGVNAVNKAFGKEVFREPEFLNSETGISANYSSAQLKAALSEAASLLIPKAKFRDATSLISLSDTKIDPIAISEEGDRGFQNILAAHARALLEENRKTSPLTIGDVTKLLTASEKIESGNISDPQLVEMFRAAMKVSSVSEVNFNGVTTSKEFLERIEAVASTEQETKRRHKLDRELLMATGTVSGPALGKVLTDSRDLIGERHRPLEQALAELKKAGLTMEVTAFDGLCVFRDKKGEVVEAPTIDGLFVVKDGRPVFTSYGAEDLAAEIKKLLSLKK